MWGRRLRTPLDLLLPKSPDTAKAKDGQFRSNESRLTRQFEVNDRVYARNYSAGPLWLQGVVTSLQGNVMYEVRLCDSRVVIRHVDQLRSRVGEDPDTVTSVSPQEEQVIDSDTSCQPRGLETAGSSDSGELETQPSESLGETENSSVTPSSDEIRRSRESTPSEAQETQVRRSTRVRHPPLRFEEQCLV